MDVVDIVLAIVGLVVACLVPATGWIVKEVISLGARHESLRATVEERGDMREKIETSLLSLNATMGTISASVSTLVERTEQFQRVLDRHERYLESTRP